MLDTLKVPLLKVDEFLKFSEAVKDLSKRRPTEIEQIVSQLTPPQKEMLKKLLQTRRIVIRNNNNPGAPTQANMVPDQDVQQVPRKLLHIRKRQ